MTVPGPGLARPVPACGAGNPLRIQGRTMASWNLHRVPTFAIILTTLTLSRAGDSLRPDQRVDPLNAYSLCKTLSAPEFEGRLTGHRGYDRMARWAAFQFEQWGLRPAYQDGYLQPFPTEVTVVDTAAMTLLLPDTEGTIREQSLQLGRDFLPLLYTDSATHQGEVVFVGWGIHAPKLGYDDYDGVDLHGRFALCFRGTPQPGDPRWKDHDEHRTRMKLARDKGALGLIYIYEDPIANPNGDWIQGFTPAVIGQKVADQIFKEKGLQSSALRSDLLKYRKPLSFATGSSARVAFKSDHKAAGTGYNIVGMVPGSDPQLDKEYVIVGSHADHCGVHAGLLFPGADDNASGTASVMEAARVLGSPERKPRRSVVFALFGGEESGLKGSEYLASHLPPSLGTLVGMVNIDMSGEGDGTHCGYSPDPPELKKVLDDADALIKTLRGASPIRGVGVQGSDFAPFFARGVPTLSFSSNGPHLQYHRAGDNIYRINPDMLADVSRIALAVAVRLADR
jgi:hypothetical protein